MMHGEIVNKVADSGIVSIDPDVLIAPFESVEIDLAPQLWQGLALREAAFREWVKTEDFSWCRDKVVGVFCSTDALIPSWAWMLLASRLHGLARFVAGGKSDDAATAWVAFCIRSVDREIFTGKRVVVKGCAERQLSPAAFIALTAHLQPVVKTLMFGEPCSTVPVYKSPKKEPV